MLTAGPAGDFRLDLHHAQVALGLIVGEGYGGIVEKAQRDLLGYEFRSIIAAVVQAGNLTAFNRERRPQHSPNIQ